MIYCGVIFMSGFNCRVLLMGLPVARLKCYLLRSQRAAVLGELYSDIH